MREGMVAAEFLNDYRLLGIYTGFPNAPEFAFDPVSVVEFAGFESTVWREIDRGGLGDPLARSWGEDVFSEGKTPKGKAVSVADTEGKDAVVLGNGNGDGGVCPILDELVFRDVVFLLPARLDFERSVCFFNSDEGDGQRALLGKKDFAEVEGKFGHP